VSLAAVVAVKATPLESNSDISEDLPQVAAAVGTHRESVVLERLHDFEVLSA
jgi:hypothetical protein